MSNGTTELKEPKEKKLAEQKLSATERALKAKQEMDSLFQEAIDEQLAIIKDAENKLSELGYQQESKPATKKRAASTKEKNCEICGITGHDLRNHRNQETKKKFTVKELDERGLPHT